MKKRILLSLFCLALALPLAAPALAQPRWPDRPTWRDDTSTCAACLVAPPLGRAG